MATKLAKSAFPGKPPARPRPKKDIDTSTVTKCRDAYKPARVIHAHKWDALFVGVQEGDCFRIDGDAQQMAATACALRVWLKRQGIEGIVRQQARTDDGVPRVWLVKIVKDPRNQQARP